MRWGFLKILVKPIKIILIDAVADRLVREAGKLAGKIRGGTPK
jgi:hypothetical protein